VTVRLLLVDDHAVLRSGLRLLIGSQPDMEVVGEACDGAGAVAAARSALPDVVIMDLGLRGGSGLAVTAEVLAVHPAARVLVLTMHDEPAYLQAALGAGATGYVLKHAADTELLDAIRAVARGRLFVDAAFSSSAIAGASRERRGLALLSPREREVFPLVARGRTSLEIAEQLGLSPKSVETYRARFMQKLGLKSRADLVRYAIEHGALLSE
jgi:two-component system response regulator NreC